MAHTSFGRARRELSKSVLDVKIAPVVLIIRDLKKLTRPCKDATLSSSIERCPARLAQPSSPTTNIRHDQSCYFRLGQDPVNSPPTGSLLTGSKNPVDSPVLSKNILAEDKEDGDMEEDSRKQRTKDSLDCTSTDEEQETATLMPFAPCGASQSPHTNAPRRISDISVGQDSANSSVLYDSEEENFDNQELRTLVEIIPGGYTGKLQVKNITATTTPST